MRLVKMFNTPLLLDTSIGLAAVPMLPALPATVKVMPSVAEVEVIVPPVRKILPAREVRVISLAVMSLTMVMSPISAVIEIAPVVFTVPGSRVFRLISICD